MKNCLLKVRREAWASPLLNLRETLVEIEVPTVSLAKADNVKKYKAAGGA